MVRRGGTGGFDEEALAGTLGKGGAVDGLAPDDLFLPKVQFHLGEFLDLLLDGPNAFYDLLQEHLQH